MKHKFKYLELQATVDLAWAHFFAKEIWKIQSVGEHAESMVPARYLLAPTMLPEVTATESHYFTNWPSCMGYMPGSPWSWSKNREQVRSLVKDRDALYGQLKRDKESNRHLSAVAESYVLSLYYGQMFSPRSRSLVITFDQIYEQVKGFNMVVHHVP